MARWISLQQSWKLQDVQAGLNVIIAFLCAGGIFVLVRYCWLLAARRVTQKRDVPAYSLLSLNTVGETIDVVWLLRKDLFASRYHGLLVQCICVMLLTIATLMSGFIARFSTRYGTITTTQTINGSIARRHTGAILYAEVDTNQTLAALQLAEFPQTQLLEYLPDPDHQWQYVADQWNNSWSMACEYNRSTDIPDPRATGNCTNGLQSEFPPMTNNYHDWKANYTWSHTSTGWRNDVTEWSNWLIFSHGVRRVDYNKGLKMWTGLEMRSVTIYLSGIPYNATVAKGCSWGTGPIEQAFYTSCSCKLTRNIGNRSVDDLFWGAYPDLPNSDINSQVDAYIGHYGNRFRQESSQSLPITIIEGEELAMFYQAYLITKDVSTAPYAQRPISVQIRVPQISLICIICCSVAAFVVISGLVYYWIFLFRHWNRLDKTPQSKLDWMLQTLRKENEDIATMKHRLSRAMTSGAYHNEAVPLNYMDNQENKSMNSTTNSNFAATPEFHDDFETPALASNFSGLPPTSTWFPSQYERVNPQAIQGSFGSPYLNRTGNGDYAVVHQQSPQIWHGTPEISFSETAYDPGRR